MKKQRGWLRRAIYLLIFAAIAAGVFFGYPYAETAYRRYEAARALDGGRNDRAIELLFPEIKKYPADRELRMKLIDLFLTEGNYGRAENLIAGGIHEQGGQSDLYALLCDVYVRQDKLLDAVKLLNDLSNPRVKSELEGRRPLRPVPNPPPGHYEAVTDITLTVPEGATCYYSLNGLTPSVAGEAYGGVIALPPGRSQLTAVCVSADGLVSDWVRGVYEVENLAEALVFEDPVIEQAVRGIIGVPDGQLIAGQLAGITELTIEGVQPIRTLNDLAHMTKLTKLALEGDQEHADISAIRTLTNLQSLSLQSMRLDSFDIDALSGLNELKNLDLSRNFISILSSVGGLTGLETLSVADNSVTDASPLLTLTALRELDMSGNGIESTEFFAEMTKLETLSAEGNRVRDLSGLSKLKALRALNLSHNAVVDTKPLSGLQLTSLDLSSNKELFSLTDDEEDETVINTLSPLGMITTLEQLRLDDCKIADVSPLNTLVNLRLLSLNQNKLTSLDGMETLTELRELSFNHNNVRSLMPLKAYEKLETLRLEYNGLPSLVAIKELPSIKVIYAFGNPVTEKVKFTAPNVTVYYG